MSFKKYRAAAKQNQKKHACKHKQVKAFNK